MKPVKERLKVTTVVMPPAYCSGLCTNSMNEACIEDCAQYRDCKWFQLKKIHLPKAPRFPLNEFLNTMSIKERQVIVAAYLYLNDDFNHKVAELLRMEFDDEPDIPLRTRSNFDRIRSQQVPPSVQVTTLHSDSEA